MNINSDMISGGQRFSLNKLLSGYAKARADRLYLLSTIIGRAVGSSSHVTLAEWRKLRDEAWPEWTNNNWTPGEAFDKKARAIMREYEVDVLGQRELPL